MKRFLCVPCKPENRDELHNRDTHVNTLNETELELNKLSTHHASAQSLTFCLAKLNELIQLSYLSDINNPSDVFQCEAKEIVLQECWSSLSVE